MVIIDLLLCPLESTTFAGSTSSIFFFKFFSLFDINIITHTLHHLISPFLLSFYLNTYIRYSSVDYSFIEIPSSPRPTIEAAVVDLGAIFIFSLRFLSSSISIYIIYHLSFFPTHPRQPDYWTVNYLTLSA